MVTGPIALAYNIPGVDTLVLNGELIAKIFNEDVTNWNDPAIAALNPDVTLPDLVIQSVHRADDSGTTENFTKYLKAAGPDAWPFEPAKAWAAPGGIAGQGTDGVAQEVKGKEGTIGYIEWGFAVDNDLPIAQIDNGAGAVELTGETAGAAVAAAEVVGTGNDLALKLDYATTEPGAYPLVLVTYEIVCSANNGDKADVLKAFLGYTATERSDLPGGTRRRPAAGRDPGEGHRVDRGAELDRIECRNYPRHSPCLTGTASRRGSLRTDHCAQTLARRPQCRPTAGERSS